MPTILIAEDEERIASFVSKGLRAAGFSCVVVGNGRDALAHAVTQEVDLVLLDVGLPGIDGFEVLKRLRVVDADLPVIMLTARTSPADTLAGLEGGADDYIPKPFRFDELLARVKLRMRGRPGGEVVQVLTHGDASLDLRSRRLSSGGQVSDLSAREFALAEEFFRHPDQVLTREQLLSRVWGYDFDPGSNVVDVYVRYLRAKLGPDRIETVRGAGYRLVQAGR
ncbi:MAG TPA: response regulator transcription factor [Pseudolysinimonas sp.]|nr:response regulator transcription factor [Pseudolysinimonas sp.]